MQKNMALEKAAEEMVKNMAVDEPLLPRKINMGAGRNLTLPVREPWGSFEEQLNGDEHRAYVEIRIGHLYYTAGMGERMVSYGKVYGGSGYSDALADYTDTLKRYNLWRKELSQSMPKVLAACIDVIGQGKTFKQAERDSYGTMTDKTVKSYVLIGIREYLYINKK